MPVATTQQRTPPQSGGTGAAFGEPAGQRRPDWLGGLNASQRDAVETRDGPLLILAGAGTGKTRVITVRIAELMVHGIEGPKILAVTFTNKAAEEMAHRVGELLGELGLPRGGGRPFVGTFHALCADILEGEIHHLGRPRNFSIFDRCDQEAAARAALRAIRVVVDDQASADGGRRRDSQTSCGTMRPGDLLTRISQWKTQGLRAGAVATRLARSGAEEDEHLAAAAYGHYERALLTAGALDFDDLLLCVGELFAAHPEALARQQARWSHILVDEWQDTNAAQYRLIRALARPHRNLCVVGDDDQSIYGFRGACMANIMGFERDFPEAMVIRLEDNYRSVPGVLTLANRLIAVNGGRHTKTLRATRVGGARPVIIDLADEAAEATYVVGEISRAVAAAVALPGDFAILLRTNEQTRPFESELRAANLAYVVVGGTSFYDRKEVRDILAYLRLMVAPDDDAALRRVLNVPARGLGAAAVEKLAGRAGRLGQSLWGAMGGIDEEAGVSPKLAERFAKLADLLRRWQARLTPPSVTLTETARAFVEDLAYRDEVERLYSEPGEQASRWGSVEDVFDALTRFCQRIGQDAGPQGAPPAPRLADFLRRTSLWGREDDGGRRRDRQQGEPGGAVRLITLHSAKGLEFPRVYLVGLEEGLLPHERSLASGQAADIDEERRLCYVGLTRARDALTITRARARLVRGQPRPCLASRFLFEMTGRAMPLAMVEALEEAARQRAMTPQERAALRRREHKVRQRQGAERINRPD